MLGDPLVFPAGPSFQEKYPSPEHLMARRDSQCPEYDPKASDLFSLAMCILQASALNKLQRIYVKNLINYDNLKANLKRCPYDNLRKVLTDILLGTVAERMEYLDRLQAETPQRQRKIKLLSVQRQKQKSQSRSKSRKKIQLTKNHSTATLVSQPTLSQVASQPLL